MDAQDQPARQLFGWFWRSYVRQSIGLLLLGSFFLIIEGGALGALSYMVRPMFDDVFIGGDRSAVFWVAFLICGIFLARAVATFAQRALLAHASRRVAMRLQSDLVGHMLRLDSAFYSRHAPGKLMERVRGDTNAAVEIVTLLFSSFGRDLTALISLLFVALTTDWLWTLVALIGVPLIVLPVVALQKLIRRISRSILEQAARVTTIMDESFHGIDTIKLHGIEQKETNKAAAAIDAQTHANARGQTAEAGVPALMDVVAAVGFLGVLTLGGMQIIDGDKTVGDFMAFFTAIALLFEPLRRLGALSGVWQRARVSLERVRAVFDETPKITSPERPLALPADLRSADIVVQDVTFGYGDQPILSNLSLTARHGQTTALVGPSGAGKSTVFRLISRLIDPDDGAITLGGTDLRQLDLAGLRNLFSVVAQDTALFDDTIRANICLGQTPGDDQLQRALDAAHVTEFVERLPQGLDTPVGPRGSNLSGGQRQRIAIARAILRDTPFLLLDEATSALDTKSEALVQDALDSLAKDRTTLVIAHRLSTIRNADKIVVMDQGQVVDQGTHDELLARGGLYAALASMQFQA